MPSSKTNIEFVNRLPDSKQLNILYHINYYNGGGVATADFNKDGLMDIYFTTNTKGNNKLYLNKGDFVFEDITAPAGVAGGADWCSGVTIADVNADGYPDIYVCAVAGKLGLKGTNELFINNRNNTFTESAAEYGLNIQSFAQQSVFFDYDHDGDLDCFILNQSEQPFAYIVDTSNRRKYDAFSGDKLLRNDCNTVAKKFTDVSNTSGIWQSKLGYGLGLGIGDFNNDGWDDIYVSNDFHENDYYYVNNKNGTFSDEGAKHFRHFSRFSMGNDIADYNNDGQLDVVTVDMLPPDETTLKTYGSDEQFDTYKQKITSNGFQYQFSRNCLQRNNGNGLSFSDVSLMNGVSATDWSWSPLFTDIDNDGIKDLIVTSGIPKRPVDMDYVKFISNMYVQKQMQNSSVIDKDILDKIPDGASWTFAFKGNEDGLFTNKTDIWGTKGPKGYFNGASFADLDNDGDRDLIVNCINSKAVVYKNNTATKNFITFQLRGDSLNTMGIGAKVYLFAKGKLQYQQLMLTRGFQSASEPRLHFGLGEQTNADSIVVVWPNQAYQVLANLASNKQYELKQSDATGVFQYTSFFKQTQPLFTDVTDSIKLNWQHKENDFIDFNRQYLIPHMQSTRGPKITVADINKDGLDDFFVCGAKGQPGYVMQQKANGTFSPVDTSVFFQLKPFEDVDAVFFDANNDTWPDLLVVSGGNELPNGDPLLLDRLYMNNGKGAFIFSPQSLPVMRYNKSCIKTADIDKDGDLDVFIGVLADAKQYGIPQTSFLLVNDGKGNFKYASEKQIDLNNTGIVTTASFADVNNDSWVDLLVTGEWMPVKIFLNEKGNFKTTDILKSTGLWQTVYAADVNGDGFTDILAGNWGHNSKLYAGKNGPLKLYVKDFDKNGSVEQVMAYTVDGKEYTFLAKDELERPLPVLKKVYLTYGEVAGKTVDYIFYDLFKDYLELKAETLSSTCFLNDGKGNFTPVVLPNELQMAPLMSFATDKQSGVNNFIAAGNFYGVVPYEGRYDAMIPVIFSYNTNRFSVAGTLPFVHGEVRDIQWLKRKEQPVLMLARNNDDLLFFKPSKN